ncbi:MAG: VWA domain-containing protein [Cyclobacteriaceae bacterium]
MKRRTALSHHVIQFCAFLRQKSFPIGPQEQQEALQALVAIDWKNSTQFKLVLQCTLCKSYEQFAKFDELYFHYWKSLSKSVDSKVKEVATAEQQPKPKPPSFQEIKSWLHGNQAPEEEVQMAQASNHEAKNAADIKMINPTQLQDWREIILLIERLVQKLPSRRYVSSKSPKQLHFRATLNRNMRYGGEIVELRFKEKKLHKTQIVLFCDVSKSMELYSKFVLHMMYMLQNGLFNLQCYAFSTSLYDVSKPLQSRDLQGALKALTTKVEGWSGGTNMGASIGQLLSGKGNRYLHGKTFVFVVSDGWDGGDIGQLDKSLRKLKSRVNKLIWINPVAQSTNYSPEVLGMKTALPYVDYLIPSMEVSGFKKWLRKMVG